MNAKEKNARALFANGYNCAQAVLGAFCEDDGLEVNAALKLASGFGGGLRCGEVCGAVSGAIMVIGLKCGFYIENDLQQKNFCYQKTYEFIETFKKEKSSILCRELLGVDIRAPEDHFTPEARARHKTVCPELVAATRYKCAALTSSFGTPFPCSYSWPK